MAIRAVLFDVGGPLNTEQTLERLVDEAIRAGLAAEGRSVSDAAYTDAARRAVESFAPNAYQAIIWRLAGPDVAACARIYQTVVTRLRAEDTFELRAGITELLERLHGRGLRLGLAANQPPAVLAALDAAGIGRYFHFRDVSGVHGLRKPDVRLFLHAAAALGVEPSACIMVGDRIDNDIAPARLLGMRTVLFRTGRHMAQQPRSWEELPDVEVHDVAGLEAAILRLLAM